MDCYPLPMDNKFKGTYIRGLNFILMVRFRYVVLVLLALSFGAPLFAQKGRTIPSADVQTLRGRPFDTQDLSNGGKPMIINFWATWCKPCKRELNAIDEVYEKWQKETGVKLFAISVDDARSKNRVRPFVNGSGWDYKVYLDPNQNFMRALNVNNPPHTFLVNGNGKIGWEHNGYAPGDEDKLYKKLKALGSSKKAQEGASSEKK